MPPHLRPVPPAAPARRRGMVRHAQWGQLLALSGPDTLPLQTRLRQAVVQAILAGRLTEGAALPSSRELARVLGLSRNTVTAAFQLLVDEGFLRAHARSGMTVAAGRGIARVDLALAGGTGASVETPVAPSPGGGPVVRLATTAAPDWSARVRRSMAKAHRLGKPAHWRDAPYPFIYGQHDPALFPVEEFRECCARSLARAHLPQWAPDLDSEDVPELVEEIRQRVLPARGVFALAEEILITVGAQQAFHLLAETLLDDQTRLGFEEPGYPHARNAFALRRPHWVPLALDGQGLQVDALPPLDYLFVTPSHQSPTTTTLPLQRRERLLALAQSSDMVIIEDDYEAENLHTGSPMPALKSLDRSGRVVYI
ncbi:MAG: PLP-dependent aminotransferase family protein, partial [Aquabacterium sp.]